MTTNFFDGNLTLDSSNSRIGIGTTTPSTIFDINGNVKFTGATMGGHILPTTNAQYDLGSAEYKIRHLFLSDNSLWVGDTHKITISGGKMKFRKRITTTVPVAITAAGGSEAAALANAGVGSLADMKLHHWEAYIKTLDGHSNSSIKDVFRDDVADYDEDIDSKIWIETGDNIYYSSGNVGIGTDSPTSKLQVNGTVAATTFSGAGTSLTGTASSLTVGNATTAVTVSQAAQTAITSVGTLTALQVDNINIDGNTISSTAGTDLNITPLAGQQIVLDGTIVIDAGVITGATSITSASLKVTTGAQNNYVLTSDANGNATWQEAQATGSAEKIYEGLAKVECFDNTNDDYITFETCNDDTTAVERMRITSAGNVGIGTDSPNTNLEVSGASSRIRVYDGTVTRNPGIELVRGSTTFGNDEYNDWRIHVEDGDLKFFTQGTDGSSYGGASGGNSVVFKWTGKSWYRNSFIRKVRSDWSRFI